MKTLPWSKFYWSDWMRDGSLRACSYAAKGLWMDMLCQMDACPERGFLLVGNRAATPREIAKLVGGEYRAVGRLLVELEANGVCSRDDRGALFSRRMTRDCDKMTQDRVNGKLGGNPVLLKNKGLAENGLTIGLKLDTDTDLDREIEEKKESKNTPFPPSKAPPKKAAGAVAPRVIGFEDFWHSYPRKQAKGAAERAFKAALKIAPYTEIIAGVERARFSANPKYIPMPATWLNGHRWLDEQDNRDPVLVAAGIYTPRPTRTFDADEIPYTFTENGLLQ